MTIKSKLRKGLQSRGKTSIDANITLEKTGTQISVSQGTFINVNGKKYSVPATTKDIGTSQYERRFGVYLAGTQGNERIEISQKLPEDVIQTFVLRDWFIVPENTSELSNIDMYAYGWIDTHPSKVMKDLPDNAEAVKHSDIQKLKSSGNELELKSTNANIQKPENQKNKNVVNPV